MYQAEIEYTEETCLRLALVQDKCYGKARLFFRIFFSMIPLVAAYFVGIQKPLGVILIVLAVFFFYSTNFMYERDASKALLGTPEKYRKVKYYFHRESISIEAADLKKQIPSADLYSLAKDGLYYYLFINPQQAYMLELKGDSSAKEQKEFEGFLVSKVNKKWISVHLRRTLTMALHDQVKKMKLGIRE